MKNLLLALFFTFAISSTAQNRLAAVLELGGPGLLSINAEYAILQKESYQVNLRAGFGYVPPSIGESYSVPVGGNLVYRLKKRHHVEAGMVVAYTEGYNRSTPSLGVEKVTYVGSALYFSPSVGYRYDKLESGIILRIAYTPLILLHDYFDPKEIDEAYIDAFGQVFPYPDEFVPAADDHYGWLSLSVGYRF